MEHVSLRPTDGRFHGPIQPTVVRISTFVGLMLTIGVHLLGATNSVFAADRSPQYILLRNDHVLHGTITTEGKSFTVRRDADAQLTVRSDQVLAIRDDLPSLFAVRQSMNRRGNRSTLSDHLDDARWCVDQNMPAQATALLMEVYRLSPNHPVAMQLEKRLRRTVEVITNEAPHTEVSQSSFTAAQPVLVDPKPNQEDSRITMVTAATAPEDLHGFTSRVQPILISRCGQCHHSEASTDWKLVLPLSGTRVPQKGTMANLRATMDYCRPGDAERSELLKHGTVFHGAKPDGAESTTTRYQNQPPIAEHEHRLIETISHWINQMSEFDNKETDAATNQEIAPNEPTSPLAQAEPSRVIAELTPPPVLESTQSPQWHAVSSGNSIPMPDEPKLRSDKPRQPIRLPIVENPNDVRLYNRETEIRRRFGL